ncbi:hypothetical protein [Microtetraspora sp. AC03309]|uniref:hypothetical protein n=1 Tax=Microtetraspora sp. AC03309 TaxID=2779376 RepID=UPI001E4684AA|nr:hypothetical protein [Microtetraspora sp. AC03309]
MDLSKNPDVAGLADTTELHRYAEALLVHLTADGSAPVAPPGLDDVSDYWLAPAVQALVLTMAGEDAMEPLSRAARLDEGRTALFLCLALAVAGHGDRIHASWLGTAFGDLSDDHPVTSGQRAVWLAAARGAYGPVGKIFVLRKLDAVAVPAEDALWLDALVPDDPAIVVPPSLKDFPQLAEIPEIAAPAQAADRLTRLRERCAEITSSRQPATVSKIVTGSVWPDAEPIAVLRTLIGQGGHEGPLSSLRGHLLQDVQPGAEPHLAALALHVAAPAVKAAAESLLHAAQEPPPEAVTVPVLGHPAILRPEGPDRNSMHAAEHGVVTESVRNRRGNWLGYVLIGIGVVLLGTGFAVHLVAALAGIAVAGWGGFLLWKRRVQEQADLDFVQARLAELNETAEGAVWALHEHARESLKRADAATEDFGELTRLLRRGPRAA